MNDTVPPSRAAILLVQLGTPDKPEVPEVRRYLREFLSDRRVVEQSPLIWWPILYSMVLTRRPKESAEKYRSIWTKAGSPLLVNTKLVAEALQDELNKRGRQVEVVWAMRYGNPSMVDALRDLRDRGFSRIVVLPMYPQYSAATSGTVFDVIAREFRRCASCRASTTTPATSPPWPRASATPGASPRPASPRSSSSVSTACRRAVWIRATPT